MKLSNKNANKKDKQNKQRRIKGKETKRIENELPKSKLVRKTNLQQIGNQRQEMFQMKKKSQNKLSEDERK